MAIAPSRILVVRLDRLGDVVLSTPVLDELRRAYPDAFIAMLVRPACRELVEGHPALNEVIVYEKEGRHRSVVATIKFARSLRRHGFDTALILHPSNRSHWIPWLAHIPRRIGWNKKSGWLLTDQLPHRKQEGAVHEAVYTLQLLEPLGLKPAAPRPRIAVNADAAARVERLVNQARTDPSQRLIAMHPSASCVSKRWLPERFARVADRLIREQGVRICLIAGPDDTPQAQAVAHCMQERALNLVGRLGVAELAALLARCALLVSNDSGPVHIAAAVGTPVVDIFGRNQAGLSPARWGPLGEGHVVLHKEVGCVTCLAHNCDIDFLCLTELSAEEVYQAAVSVLQQARQPKRA